jgi:hypothetical protein
MRAFDLVYCCRLYAEVAGFDRALATFRERTEGRADLRDGEHRVLTLEWLRRWGCRNLAVEDTRLTLAALETWAASWWDRLQGPDVTLDRLTDAHIELAADAYADLAAMHAAHRRARDRRVAVTFGATAAAKTLYAVRPEAFLPWDDAIRRALGFDGGRDAYRDALRRARAELTEAVADAGCAAAELPAFVGRPASSPPKLIDEHDWVRYARGHAPPEAAELARWIRLLDGTTAG